MRLFSSLLALLTLSLLAACGIKTPLSLPAPASNPASAQVGGGANAATKTATHNAVSPAPTFAADDNKGQRP